MDIQKQVAFEKFHARDCNCDYEDLKRRLDRHELLTGHRYPPTSPRHEAWLTWCAAWDAKAQAVPEGFVLVPKEPTKEYKDVISQYLDELWMGEWGCDWDGFICVNGIDPNHVWKIVTNTKAMIEAQEQS